MTCRSKKILSDAVTVPDTQCCLQTWHEGDHQDIYGNTWPKRASTNPYSLAKKREYQRNYMRQKRGGLKPKKPPRVYKKRIQCVDMGRNFPAIKKYQPLYGYDKIVDVHSKLDGTDILYFESGKAVEVDRFAPNIGHRITHLGGQQHNQIRTPVLAKVSR